jgi:Haem-dependent oxidative N-demethylase, alpha subunit-like
MTFDFEAAVTAPFRMQPGLRRIAGGVAQLTPLAPWARHQREKLAVLSAFWPQALCARPGFESAAAIEALCEHAASEHPRAWSWDGDAALARTHGVRVSRAGDLDCVRNRSATGAIVRCVRELPAPWRLPALISLSSAEDFAIVDAGRSEVPWIAVALPSRWAPEEKVGRSFGAIHAPVADNELVLQAAPALLRLVTRPGRWERFVWTVTDQPRLHAHPARVDPQGWRQTTVSNAWWRTERQTFIPLAGRGQAIFTIHVEVEPLAAVVASPARAAALHSAIASMTPSVLRYRGLAGVREPLLEWLEARGRAT